MAKTIDLTILPAVVTIENISVDKTLQEIDIASNPATAPQESGTTAPGAQPESKVVKDTALSAISSEVQAFKRNLFATLQSGDKAKFVVTTSNELLYWLNLGDKFPEILSVTAEAQE